MIYFDNAATTNVSANVKETIINALDSYGNPSSQYDLGKDAKKMINNARHNIETTMGLYKNSIVFTGSGSEADNLAIKAGFLHGLNRGRNKIVISAVEHHAVTHAAEQMALLGAEIVTVDVDAKGCIDYEDLRNKVDYNTAIVSVMLSNNEVGSINNPYLCCEIAHEKGALFHIDAVQGITHMKIHPNMADLIAFSGHKIHAPKGIGALYINPMIKEEFDGFSLICGGKQEMGLRAGTENVPYIVGFSQAITDLYCDMPSKVATLESLNNYFTTQLLLYFPYIRINGHVDYKKKNPSIINFSVGYADAASIVEYMNLNGICISSGSACNTGSPKPSHVLTAMGCSERTAFSSVRVSLSELNTKEEIDKFIDVLRRFEKIFRQN